MLEDVAVRIGRLERRASGEHLVHHDAERVEIAARIEMLSFLEIARLLGRRVFEFAEEHAGLRQSLAALTFGQLLGDAEVDHLDQQFSVVILRQHDVLGRDVAMDQPHRVQMIEAGESLNGNFHRQS